MQRRIVLLRHLSASGLCWSKFKVDEYSFEAALVEASCSVGRPGMGVIGSESRCNWNCIMQDFVSIGVIWLWVIRAFVNSIWSVFCLVSRALLKFNTGVCVLSLAPSLDSAHPSTLSMVQRVLGDSHIWMITCLEYTSQMSNSKWDLNIHTSYLSNLKKYILIPCLTYFFLLT